MHKRRTIKKFKPKRKSFRKKKASFKPKKIKKTFRKNVKKIIFSLAETKRLRNAPIEE